MNCKNDYKVPLVIHCSGGFVSLRSPLCLHIVVVSLQIAEEIPQPAADACVNSLSICPELQSRENWTCFSSLYRQPWPSPLSRSPSFVWLCCRSAERNTSRAATLFSMRFKSSTDFSSISLVVVPHFHKLLLLVRYRNEPEERCLCSPC